MKKVETLSFNPSISLDISQQNLSWIGRLKHLKVLKFEDCVYQNTLPSTLVFCQKLECLYLRNCSFKDLPGFILNLENLKYISREDNPLDVNIQTPIYYARARNISFKKIGKEIESYNVNHSICYWNEERDVRDLHTEYYTQPIPLVLFAALAVASSVNFKSYDFNVLNLPARLKSICYDLMEFIEICDNCFKGTYKSGKLFLLFLDSKVISTKNVGIKCTLQNGKLDSIPLWSND